MSYTIPIEKLTKDDIPTAGGKGANLGEMTGSGFPVPPGFVLTTEAYDAFVEANDLKGRVLELAGQASVHDPKQAEDSSQEIKNLFLSGEIPNAVQIELLSAYDELTADGQIVVAVRSSATAEDLPEASFAGQQETFLNIESPEALLEAVKKCWASLWTTRAIAYREHQDIDHVLISLAVVVQKLIPAESAGILFTANPLDGERGQIVINGAWGLGEAVVSGQVTPDTVIIDKAAWQVTSRQTSAKTLMTIRTEAGTKEQPVPEQKQIQPVLENAAAIELAQLGAEIEAHFGVPMDIEWAIAGNEMAILQARPITHLPPAPLKDVRWDPPRPGTIWMRRQIVEHMPQPLSPLFDELYLQQGLDRSMQELANFLGDLGGLEIKVWDFVDPPFATTINGYAYSIASFKFNRTLIPMALRLYVTVLPKMIRHLVPRWRDVSLPAYLATAEHWKSIDLAAASDDDLLAGIRELALADAVYWFAAAVPLGLARMTDTALDRFLQVTMSSRSGSYLRGFPSIAMDAQAELEDIARQINTSDILRKEVLAAPSPRVLQALRETPGGESLLDAFQQYQDKYGHQIYNLDFAAPTLADDPTPLVMSLKSAVAHPEQDARARQTALAQERDVRVARTRRALNPVQRRIFQLLLGWAQRYAPIREKALFYVGAGWPALRRLALELGRRLTDAAALDTPDDVFYLKSAELAAASAARAEGTPRPDLAGLAVERRELREARKRLDPPPVVPPDGRLMFGPIDMGMLEPKPRAISTRPTLDGFAVSPGQVTAPASLVRSPEDFERMKPGTILVCTTTTPAWTPLFAQAVGLVTDIGGALAHGSIVAREYGIPAVMGTGAATQRIEHGEIIRVDGDSGSVTLVERIDPEEEQRWLSHRLAEEQKAAARRRKKFAGLLIGTALVLWWWRRRRKRGQKK